MERKERQPDERREDFASVLFDRGLKELPNKMTPQPERDRKVRLHRAKHREKKERNGHWESERQKLRENYNDNNEGDWQMCCTVKTFGVSESKSKKQTWNLRLSDSVTVSNACAMMCPFSAKRKVTCCQLCLCSLRLVIYCKLARCFQVQ